MQNKGKMNFETLFAMNREKILNDVHQLAEIEKRIDTRIHATIKDNNQSN
ncbi:FbpB family small basic protein [Paraliobacillus ryukyuensis]|nr:FbpB family small basic protein [Paraliobacillus ryukyuensis]